MSKPEKYPSKRGYAIGKLYEFLKEKGMYNKFVAECKRQRPKDRGNKEIYESFSWSKAEDGEQFWIQLDREFERTK